MLKRVFDIVASLAGLLVLSPFFILVSVLVKMDSKGPVLFKQSRVGKDNSEFKVLKFRTMKLNSEKEGQLTIGRNDSRVTHIGKILRKYKIDEFPQLINVLKGEMTLVGPRPEVKKYVDLYNEDQKKVLTVKPGITDVASILYRNENELLGSAEDPEKYYIENVMPVKIKYNLEYINNDSVVKDFKIILKTFKAIWF